MQREVEPQLAAGAIVVSDRWYHSSLAYQGTGADRDWIATLNARARRPDLTMFLQVRPEVAAQRRVAAGRVQELFEDLQMQQEVDAGYKATIAELVAAGERDRDDRRRAARGPGVRGDRSRAVGRALSLIMLRRGRGGGTLGHARAAARLVLVAACGPKVVDRAEPTFDEDLGASARSPPPTPRRAGARPRRPPGKGLRTGTIERAQLVAVLDGGPGAFLRQLEVTPRMDGERFVGWQLVQLLDPTARSSTSTSRPATCCSRSTASRCRAPISCRRVWDSLRTANEVVAAAVARQRQARARFAIEPKVAREYKVND